MTDPNRWSQVEHLYHTALELEPNQRDVFLAQACGNDEELRREVESLLAQTGSTGGLIDRSAWAAEAGGSETRTIVTPGAKLGPYQILDRLGAGGMGEVYRAVDTRLDRRVAIKISSERFSGRFEREARAISALNHPHICTLYDVGPNYLVMELIEGETLTARLAKGPLPLDLVLRYGVEIADALAVAHSCGIVHRDLKPGNVMVTRTGIKVLDFGLAKVTAGSGPQPEVLTAEHAVMGTPAYMAPEQLSGKEVDARTDLFSFGAVLYEMVTGQRAFPRHLDRTPPPPAKTHPGLQRIITKLLETDRSSRYQGAPEVLAGLERLRQPQARSRKWMALAVAAAVLAAVVVALIWPKGPIKPLDRSEWVQITNFPDSVSQPALSPDGRMLAFVRGIGTFYTEGQVYLKMLPGGQPTPLTHDDLMKMGPVFSPDGSRIAYTTVSNDFKWDTWTVPVRGGAPQRWLDNASGLVWAGPRQLLFSQIETGTHMAIVTTGESRAQSRVVYTPPNTRGMAHRSYLSPDGKWVLLVEMDESGAWAPCRVVPFDGTSAGRQIGPSGACTSGAWAPDGKCVYVSALTDGSYHIWRQKFPDGRPEQLTSGPAEEEGIAMAPDGKSLIAASGLRERTVSLHDARGDRQISVEGYAFGPSLSPDGNKLYYRLLKGTSPSASAASNPSELWVTDLASGRSERLLPGFDVTGYHISSDGRRVVFAALDSGKPHLWLAPTDRSSPPQSISNAEGDMPFFGPSGEIFFRANESEYSFAFRIREDGAEKQKLTSAPVFFLRAVSPNGQWFVGDSPDTGQGATKALIAYPISGGAPVRILGHDVQIRWSPDMKYWSLSVGAAGMEGESAGKTYIFRLSPGHALPDIPPGGFHSEAGIAAVPGVQALNYADVSLGAAPGTYAYSVGTTRRNLCRIPLP